MYLRKEAVAAVLVAYSTAGKRSKRYHNARNELATMATLVCQHSMPRFRQLHTLLPAPLDADDLVQGAVLHVLNVGHKWSADNGGSAFGWLTTVIWRHWSGMIRAENTNRERFDRFAATKDPRTHRGRTASAMDSIEAYDAPTQLELDEDAEEDAMIQKWLDDAAEQPRERRKRRRVACASIAIACRTSRDSRLNRSA
ncbi:MAG TPA: sigma factor [Pirellulales bacterium]|nr:sigma factor [Pirellulales bacterium]